MQTAAERPQVCIEYPNSYPSTYPELKHIQKYPNFYPSTYPQLKHIPQYSHTSSQLGINSGIKHGIILDNGKDSSSENVRPQNIMG